MPWISARKLQAMLEERAKSAYEAFDRRCEQEREHALHTRLARVEQELGIEGPGIGLNEAQGMCIGTPRVPVRKRGRK